MSIPINNVPCTSVAVNKWILTSPLPGVWRLQSAADINDKGVIQTLAAITGKNPEGVNAVQKLACKLSVVTTDNDEIKVKLNTDNICFINNNDKKILNVFNLLNEFSTPQIPLFASDLGGVYDLR